MGSGGLGANAEAARNPEAVLRSVIETAGSITEDFLTEAPPPLLALVNDATRPTLSAEVLCVVHPRLEAWLERPGRELDLVIATGTQSVALPEEVDRIFSVELVEAHAGGVLPHEANGRCRRTSP